MQPDDFCSDTALAGDALVNPQGIIAWTTAIAGAMVRPNVLFLDLLSEIWVHGFCAAENCLQGYAVAGGYLVQKWVLAGKIMRHNSFCYTFISLDAWLPRRAHGRICGLLECPREIERLRQICRIIDPSGQREQIFMPKEPECHGGLIAQRDSSAPNEPSPHVSCVRRELFGAQSHSKS